MFKFAQTICIFSVAVAGLCSADAYAQTNIPVEVTHTTGLVGLAEGQTAQLNALNPDAGGPACSGLLSLVADDGTILKAKTVTVSSGTGQHISLDSVADLALSAGARREIRGAITIAAAPPATSSSGSSTSIVHEACRLIGTLEIFNTADGHTVVTLGTAHKVVSPPIAGSEAGN